MPALRKWGKTPPPRGFAAQTRWRNKGPAGAGRLFDTMGRTARESASALGPGTPDEKTAACGVITCQPPSRERPHRRKEAKGKGRIWR